jgi:hypothetical protein
MLDFDDIENTYLPERMSILNAYYFPKQAYQNLYPEITPVNSFRVILNQFFGSNLPLLDDFSYFGTQEKRYEFFDITQTLNEDSGLQNFVP